MNRLLPMFLITAFLTLAGAATASANTAMKIVAEPDSDFSLADDEWWEPELRRWSLNGTTFGYLGAGNANFKYKYVRCLGGEVRGELIIDAYRWSSATAATVTAHLDLYEGTSCSTTDFEGQSPNLTFTLKIGETKRVNTSVWNDVEGAHDFAAFDIYFRAMAA